MMGKRKAADMEPSESERDSKRIKLAEEEEEEEEGEYEPSDAEEDSDISCEEQDQCRDCEHKRDMIEVEYIKQWDLGGCHLCGCAYGPADCSYYGDACEGCITECGGHMDYEVRFLTEEELSLRPTLKPIETVETKKPPKECLDYDLYPIRKYVYIEIKDTFMGEPYDG